MNIEKIQIDGVMYEPAKSERFDKCADCDLNTDNCPLLYDCHRVLGKYHNFKKCKEQPSKKQ